MSRRARKFLIGSASMLAIYIGVFSYWWFQSPVTSRTLGGKEVRIVQFHFNTLSWHTQLLWQPAFWFVERVSGYERGGYVALEENSVIEYLR
jgi:hypothetical protein